MLRNFGFCRHDYTALSPLRRAHGLQEKYGPLLCHGNHDNTVRRRLPYPLMGTYREARAEQNASLRARRRSSRSFSYVNPAKTFERLSPCNWSRPRLISRTNKICYRCFPKSLPGGQEPARLLALLQFKRSPEAKRTAITDQYRRVLKTCKFFPAHP